MSANKDETIDISQFRKKNQISTLTSPSSPVSGIVTDKTERLQNMMKPVNMKYSQEWQNNYLQKIKESKKETNLLRKEILKTMELKTPGFKYHD
jgi:hypothetical protein